MELLPLKPCMATLAGGNYIIQANISHAGGNQDATKRRRLLARGGAGAKRPTDIDDGSLVFSGGYTLVKPDEIAGYTAQEGIVRPRWLGAGEGANRLLGGLLLHQVRKASSPGELCDSTSLPPSKCESPHGTLR